MNKIWSLKEKLMLYKMVRDDYDGEGVNWNKYGDIFNVTSNAARNKYRYTDWQKLFDDNDLTEKEVLNAEIDYFYRTYIDDHAGEEIIENNFTKEIENKLNVEKDKILLSHEIRKQNEFLKQLATEDIVVKKIISSIKSVREIQPEEINIPIIRSFKTKPQDVVLLLSDLHLGLVVNKNEVGGLSHYNRDIFKQRLENLITKIIKITSMHRTTSQIDTIHVFALGDNVHGSNDAGQWGFLHTEQNICDQIFDLIVELEKAILILSKAFKNVKFYGVYGNHGRISKRGMEKKFVNWDYILYKFLEKSSSNQKNVEFFVPRSPFQVASVQGNKFLLIHGEQVRGWGGLPFYGMVRAESKFRSLFDKSKSIEGLWEELQKSEVGDDPKDMLKFAVDYCKSFDFMCFPKETEILLPNGETEEIDKINVGEEIVDAYGEKVIVQEKFSHKYSGDIYKIKSGYNYKTVESTEDHPFLIIPKEKMECRLLSRKKKEYLCLPNKSSCYPCSKCDSKIENYKPEFIKAKNIKKGDYVKLGTITTIRNVEEIDCIKKLPNKKYNIKKDRIFLMGKGSGNTIGIPEKVILSKKIAKMFGFWLAEGSFTTNCKNKNKEYIEKINGISFTFGHTLREKEYLDFCKKVLEEDFGITKGFCLSVADDSSKTLIISNKLLGQLFYNLFGNGSHNKKIPMDMMECDIEIQKEIIYGFILGDGHTRQTKRKCKNERFEINCSTVSKTLGNQLFLLLHRCGYSSSLSTYVNSAGNICYTNSIYGIFNEKLNNILKEVDSNYKYKKERTQDIVIVNGMLFAKIKKIQKEKVKDLPVYNFRTNGSNSYTANNYGVHNCMGHFHQMAELETSSGGRIIMNSSFAGGDDYSINELLSASTASQKFFGVHPDGKSFTYDIELDRE